MDIPGEDGYIDQGLSFIGIDPSWGESTVGYAAIDQNLKLIAIGQGKMKEALAFAGGRQKAFAALHAPARLNQGIVKGMTDGQLDVRLAEHQLFQRRLYSYKTPSQLNACKTWMKTGFDLHSRLSEFGYQYYNSGDSPKQIMEAAPEACYQNWAQGKLFKKRSLEGRIQRQLLLYEIGLDVLDPMLFFQEITRHRISMGMLPDGMIHRPPELYALAAAYTAWLALKQPDNIELLGDAAEGQIVIPRQGYQTTFL